MGVRPARASDADAISIIYGDIVKGTAISFEEAAPSREEIVRRMTLRPRLPWLVAESVGGAVGYAHASPPRHRVAYRW